MFDRTLSVAVKEQRPKSTPVKAVTIKPPAPTAKSLNVTYNRNERPDRSYAGYKSYFYQFTQKGEVGDKEIERAIISSPTMDEAIVTFERIFFRGDYYENAVIDVEIIAVDLNPERTDPIIMSY